MIKISFLNSEITGLILFFIGFYGLVARRNIIKSIISLGIMSGGVILFFLAVPSYAGTTPPIKELEIGVTSDPIGQTLMITAIIIGISVTAITLAMFIRMYHKYGTTNWVKALAKRKGNDIE